MSDGEEYGYSIDYNDKYQVLSTSVDTYIEDHINTERYGDANQLVAHLKNYFSSRKCTVITFGEIGLKLKE